jgi:hypothetical protein
MLHYNKRDMWLSHSLGRPANDSHYVSSVNTETAVAV